MKQVSAGAIFAMGLAAFVATDALAQAGPTPQQLQQQDQRRMDLRSALMKAQGRPQGPRDGGAPQDGMRQLSPEERAVLREQLRHPRR